VGPRKSQENCIMFHTKKPIDGKPNIKHKNAKETNNNKTTTTKKTKPKKPFSMYNHII